MRLDLPAPRLRRGATVWVAYSGGLDSAVLLHALHTARLPVRAIHVNHQLQPGAARWAAHCRESCGRLAVPIEVVEVQVESGHPGGPEAAAREARYAAFRGRMKRGDWLATGHHQDDQAETILLRLLRGAGVAGLAAMRAQSEFGGGTLWRPLLQVPRDTLRRYAAHHGLDWVEDPHNADPRFDRSFVRQELFPRLRERWPQAVPVMARSAAHCAEAAGLLDEVAARDLKRVAAPLGRDRHAGRGLRAGRLLDLPAARRNNLLRHWAGRAGLEAPGFDALARLEREVLRARPDASPVLAWGDTELRRFRDVLYLMRRLPPPPRGVTLEWSGQRDLALPPGCGVLRIVKPARSELPLIVGFVRGGERLKPAGSRHTRTLRKLFQEEAVPGWIRERLPLIHLDGQLAAAGSHWRATAFESLCRRNRFRFAWDHGLPGVAAG